MRVSSIRHSAFVVRDLERSLAFYQGVLGLELYRRFVECGDFISRLTGIPDVKLEWAKLIIPKGGLIELIQYHSHPDKEYDIFSSFGAPSNKIGASHVALTVHDIDGIFSELKRNGYCTKSDVLISPQGNAKILYAHDPDGSIVELIEDI